MYLFSWLVFMVSFDNLSAVYVLYLISHDCVLFYFVVILCLIKIYICAIIMSQTYSCPIIFTTLLSSCFSLSLSSLCVHSFSPRLIDFRTLEWFWIPDYYLALIGFVCLDWTDFLVSTPACVLAVTLHFHKLFIRICATCSLRLSLNPFFPMFPMWLLWHHSGKERQ